MSCGKSLPKVLLSFSLAASAAVAAATPESLPASVYMQAHERVLVAPGRRLNLYCTGEGEPTVLFDSGLGDGTLAWRTVQGEIARVTRACSYDRANYFFSDPVERRATAQAAVDDMLHLIDAAKLGDRVVLVGHSRGGLNVRLFAYEHPDRVAGVVLVDPTITERLTPAATKSYVHKYENYLARGQQLERCHQEALRHALHADGADPLKCLDDFGVQADAQEQALARMVRTSEAQPAYQATLFSERQNLFYPVSGEGDSTDGSSISTKARALGDLPLVVISADWFGSASFKGSPTLEQKQFLAWNTGQMRQVAQESTRGFFISVASRHYVQKERPDVVIDAVRQVLDLARGHAHPGESGDAHAPRSLRGQTMPPR